MTDSLRFPTAVAVTLGLAWTALLTLVFAPGPAPAAGLEEPPVVSAAAVLGERAHGPNYRVEDRVESDGFLQVFGLETPFGRYRVEGRDMLEMRLRELAALATLERMNRSSVFVESAARAAMKPIGLATGLIRDPAGTLDRTMTGVGEVFTRMGSTLSNIGHSPDRPAASALGIAAAKREIAWRLGVDPYTDFTPLADAMTQVARVTALGNLSVGAAFSAIPGAAGTAASAGKAGADLGLMVRDKTPTELRDANRTKLAAMKVSAEAITAFLDTTVFTPADQTAIVAALARLDGVGGRELFVARAAQAPSRELAWFMRKRIEMIAAHHETVERLADFVDVRDFPLNRSRGGKLVAIMICDVLAWTRPANDLVAVIDQDVKQRRLGSGVELRLSGTVTTLAGRSLREHGWTVVERAPH